MGNLSFSVCKCGKWRLDNKPQETCYFCGGALAVGGHLDVDAIYVTRDQAERRKER